MNQKRLYFANNTQRVLESVFPSQFRMVSDKTSNGYKFINATYGVEIDAVYDFMDQARHMNNLETFDYGVDFDYYEVIIKDNVINDTVFTEGPNVKVTNTSEFYDGSPTRLESTGRLTISGIDYGPIGLEYLRTDKSGSGILLVNLDIDASTAYNSIGYQSFKLDVDDLGVVDYTISGVNLAVKTQDYDNTRRDEILIPPFEKEQQSKYPLTKDIKLPSSGIDGNPYQWYTIDHYTPDNGYYWDEVEDTYRAVGYDSDFYYDDEDVKTYYRTGFNNPYGTGIYTSSYINLWHTPISGTLRVYDFDNLNLSGGLVEIEQTGTQLYYHSGVYGSEYLAEYIGYSSGVPSAYTPLTFSGEVSADPYLITSWDYCRTSGGLDDSFNWVEYPANPITNRIKINNPASRYLVEYKYEFVSKNKYISTLNASKYIKYDDSNYLFSVQGTNGSEVEIPNEFSKENTSRRAITFDGTEIRPGTVIDRMELSVKAQTNTEDLSKSNYNISLDKGHAGYTDVLYPNKTDQRSYLINEKLYDTNLTLTNEYSTVYDINYDTSYGVRMDYTSGNLYYSSGTYVDLTTRYGSANRYLRMGFKLYNPVTGQINLASSSDGSGEYWNVYINDGRYIVIQDQKGSYITYGNIDNSTTPKEIIIERDMQFDDDSFYNEYEYGVFYKDGDKPFRKFDTTRHYIANTIPSGVNTKFFENADLDVKFVQIYEELREFTNV